jgi:hypothetical protein
VCECVSECVSKGESENKCTHESDLIVYNMSERVSK